MFRFATRLGALMLLAPLAAACSDSTGPGAGLPGALSLDQLDSTVATGPTRLEVKLVSGSLTAREVHVEGDDLEEKIVSRVSAIDPAAGTITLTLGGLVVHYGSSTRFRTPSESRVERAAWEAAIASALSAGNQPPIEARRDAPGTPQDPADPSFTAKDLRLADRAGAPKLEIYVDGDNFVTVDNPPEIARLMVLGLAISITTSTELMDDDMPGTPGGASGEFEGTVSSVNVAAGTLTLADGRIIDVSGATFDALGDLFTLQSTADAVAAAKPVRAEGRGTVASAGPPMTISASSIKVEVDD
jgi:hypothetical protein